MTAATALAAHLRGEHRSAADDACEACRRGARPETGPKGAKKGGKGAQRASSGKCEHCGAPTGGRFAPGHDAKLKSELAIRANCGDAEALAELILRSWDHLVRLLMPTGTAPAARKLVESEGYALVKRRSQARQALRS